MWQLYQEKYKTDSNRLLWYNYADDGVYFVTICVQDRVCCLSNIVDNKVIYTDIWQIIHDEITNIPNNRSNVYIDQFVIMPNHVHLILYIWSHRWDDTNNYKDREWWNYNNNNLNKNNTNSVETSIYGVSWIKDGHDISDAINQNHDISDAINRVSTGWITGKNNPINQESLWTVIRELKARCTYNIRKTLPSFMRQTNYYDVIIKSNDSLYEIRKYISNNPTKRKEDKLYQ